LNTNDQTHELRYATLLSHHISRYEPTYKPGPVGDSHSSRTYIAICLKQPTRVQREQRLNLKSRTWRTNTNEHLFGLAPSGVYLAAHVTTCAVRSYRTISPLLLSIKRHNPT